MRKKRIADWWLWSGGEADAGVVVDGDVQILIACGSSLPRTLAVNAMARFDDAGQALDIEVDQVSRIFVLVTNHRRGRVERTEAVEPGATQDTADSGPAQVQFPSDA